MNFPSKPISNYNLVDLAMTFYDAKVIMKMGLSNNIFPNLIALGNKTYNNQDLKLYLEIQLIKGFGFNI